MPWALHFLLSFEGEVGGVQQEALPGVGNYLSFCTRFLFGFGVAFLLPILLDDPGARRARDPRPAGEVAALCDRRLGRAYRQS